MCFSSDIDNNGTENVKKENREATVNFMKTDAMTVVAELEELTSVNNQLDLQFFFSCMFISILYMFRAAMCPSSGELIVSIQHLVYVTLYK